MGKLAPLCLLCILFLSGCHPETYDVIYTVTHDTNTKQILYDGTYLYTYDVNSKTLFDRRLPVMESTSQAKYLLTSINTYTISYILPGSYQGDYESGCGYINYLISAGYKEERHIATSEYYDIVLSSAEGRIRVIILDNDQLKIFYENTEKMASSPPYINGKGGSN